MGNKFQLKVRIIKIYAQNFAKYDPSGKGLQLCAYNIPEHFIVN
jgi:hypothetical protein